MLNLYTFIMEFLEGTYIYQVRGKGVYDAMIIWIKQLDLKQVEVKKTTISDILYEINLIEKRPISIEDVTNVWRIAFEMDNAYAVTHIIKTNP